jgi:hypothetical protein
VREVGPVATVIETRQNGLVSRLSVPNAKMLQESVRYSLSPDVLAVHEVCRL